MSFLSEIAGAFESVGHTVSGVAGDVYGGAKSAINDVWGGTKTVATTVYNGTVSGVNRVADVAERGANTTIDFHGGLGDVVKSPLFIAGALVVAILILRK